MLLTFTSPIDDSPLTVHVDPDYVVAVVEDLIHHRARLHLAGGLTLVVVDGERGVARLIKEYKENV